MNKCDRCGCQTNVVTGSYFNTEMICVECDKKERAHPSFALAKKTEFTQVHLGNLNYEGIGLPKDLK